MKINLEINTEVAQDLIAAEALFRSLTSTNEKATQAENKNMVDESYSAIVEENELLKKKLKELENAKVSLGQIKDNEENINVNNDKIAELEKEVEFHKARSKENWNELKILKETLSTITKEKNELQLSLANIELENQVPAINDEELKAVQEEVALLKEKNEKLKIANEKLLKDTEFHKTRSKENWNELKTIKAQLEEMKKNENSKSVNEDEVAKLRNELAQLKTESENNINELKVANDKLENELDVYRDIDMSDYEELKIIRDAIKNTEKGKAFWNNVESTVRNR